MATVAPNAVAPSPTMALPPMIPPYPICRFNVDQYRRMIEIGVLQEDDRVELLEGWIAPKMPANPPLRLTTAKARIALERILPPGWFADEEKPVELRPVFGMPEPDVQVVRGDREIICAQGHPRASDLGLIVEVADSSLPRDRIDKARSYAAVSIPIYWIINLIDRQVEVHEQPSGPVDEPGYATVRFYGPEDQVPVVLDGREVGRIAVRDLLPREPAPRAGDA